MSEIDTAERQDVLQWAAENNVGFEISAKRSDLRVIAWKRQPGETETFAEHSVSLNSWLEVRHDTDRLGDDIIQALRLLQDGMDNVHLSYIPTRPSPSPA